MKPANRMQAIGFTSRQECRSRASTANEQSSRQSVALEAGFEGSEGPTETGRDKTVLLIIAFPQSASELPMFRCAPNGYNIRTTFPRRCFVCRVIREEEMKGNLAGGNPRMVDNQAQVTRHFAHCPDEPKGAKPHRENLRCLYV